MKIDGALVSNLRWAGGRRDLDAAHDAYISLRRCRTDSEINAGLWSVATHRKASDECRRQARWKTLTDPNEVGAGDCFPTPADECELRERDVIVVTAIEHLPPLQKQVIQLRYWDGEAIEQIAASLSISPNTVRSRLRLAQDKLRYELTPLLLTEQCNDDTEDA